MVIGRMYMLHTAMSRLWLRQDPCRPCCFTAGAEPHAPVHTTCQSTAYNVEKLAAHLLESRLAHAEEEVACHLRKWPEHCGERVLRQHHHRHLLATPWQARILALPAEHKPVDVVWHACARLAANPKPAACKRRRSTFQQQSHCSLVGVVPTLGACTVLHGCSAPCAQLTMMYRGWTSLHAAPCSCYPAWCTSKHASEAQHGMIQACNITWTVHHSAREQLRGTHTHRKAVKRDGRFFRQCQSTSWDNCINALSDVDVEHNGRHAYNPGGACFLLHFAVKI